MDAQSRGPQSREPATPDSRGENTLAQKFRYDSGCGNLYHILKF
jgi:hypothetical protein